MGLPTTAVLVRDRMSAIEVADNGVCAEEGVWIMSGTAATEVGFAAPADSVTTGCTFGGAIEDGNGDSDEVKGGAITAVSAVSELVDAVPAGGSVGTAATCEGRMGDSLDCEGTLGLMTSCAGADG